MREPLEIVLYVESYEDLERQCAELYTRTGMVVGKAVMPEPPGFFPHNPGISFVQINTPEGPVKVDLKRVVVLGGG
jgi:hypothetical protein